MPEELSAYWLTLGQSDEHPGSWQHIHNMPGFSDDVNGHTEVFHR
jgi:hypothetical protein